MQQDPCFIPSLENSFAAARTAGVKLQIYFKYNWGSGSNQFTDCGGHTVTNDGQDASLNTILSHITQLGPTLNQYADVIYAINAGFIGQFGEWHDSTHGNDTLSAHNQIITAELNHFPTNRHILLRRPAYKGNYLIGKGYGLTPGALPQLGHYNEKFVDDSDSELFNDPQGILSSGDLRTFYDNDVSFTVNGADAATGGGPIDGITALNRMQQYHYSLMAAYPGLISSWQTQYPNQYASMQRGLGYRFQVTQATTPNTAIRGQVYTISVNLKNNGFSKMLNQRGMWAAFNIGSSWAFSSTTFVDSSGSSDLEGLTLAAGTKTYTTNFTLPASFPTGTANVYLWLPDYAASLQTNPKFSVQLDGVTWTPSLGANLLGSSLNHIQVQ